MEWTGKTLPENVLAIEVHCIGARKNTTRNNDLKQTSEHDVEVCSS